MEARAQFGAKLKAAREARGISLREVSAVTKISTATLEALERDIPSRLPGGIFSRAFVRAYAIEVGLDPDAMVREFAERFPDAVQPLRDEPAIARPSEARGDPRWWRSAAVTLVLLLAIGAGLGMMGWSEGWFAALLQAPPMPPVAGTPAPAAVPEPAHELPQPEDGLAGDAALPVTDAVVPPIPAAARLDDVSRLVALGTEEPMRLAIQPVARCWVRVVTDGRIVLARELGAGERVEHRADGEIIVTVGDAGAFVYSLNGVPGRPLGVRGQVVTVRIRRSNLIDFVAS